MTDIEISKIKNVLNVAEQGTQSIPYGKVEVMPDGPGGVNQVTLSVGFTQHGNLGRVISEYLARGGVQTGLGRYKMGDSGLPYNSTFKGLLKLAGNDPVMQAVQEELYVSLYIGPGIRWGEAEGFVEALSMLVICDSFLHSGSILTFLRNRFPEKTPKWGGRERVWISQYIDVREKWLATHSNKLLRNTTYRTQYYRELVALNDWGLLEHHKIAMNGIKPLLIV